MNLLACTINQSEVVTGSFGFPLAIAAAFYSNGVALGLQGNLHAVLKNLSF
jgi:hypothetical protein